MEATPEKKHRGVGRVAFLARREAIAKAVTEGWPLVAIYGVHGDALGITYSQFARYVARYIRSGDDRPTAGKPVSTPGRTTPEPTQGQGQDAAPAGKSGGVGSPGYVHTTGNKDKSNLI